MQQWKPAYFLNSCFDGHFFYPNPLYFNKEKNVFKEVFNPPPLPPSPLCFFRPSRCAVKKTHTHSHTHFALELCSTCQDTSHIPESQEDLLTLTWPLSKRTTGKGRCAQLGPSKKSSKKKKKEENKPKSWSLQFHHKYSRRQFNKFLHGKILLPSPRPSGQVAHV